MSPRTIKRVKSSALRGAQAKLNRAREHFHEFEAESRRFAKEHPEPIRFALRDDPSPNLIPVMVEYVEPLDDIFAVIVGDMLHDLRCVLDYIAWEIVQRGTKVPPDDSEQAASVALPIILEGKHTKSGNWWPASKVFREAHKQQIPGARTVHLGVVERYQPYKRRNLATDHPFAVLKQLSNTAKHRRLHSALFFPATTGFKLRMPPGCGPATMEASPDIAAANALRVGMEVAYISVADKTRCDGMEIEPTATVYIGLENVGGPILDRLERMEVMAADLLLEIDAIL